MPWDRSQDGIVSSSWKDDGDLVPRESYLPFSLHKEPVDLGRVTAFKPSKFLSQHGVEGPDIASLNAELA